MRRGQHIFAAAVAFLLLVQSLSIAEIIPADNNEPTAPQACHEEGKDITCSHLKSTLAALMARNESQNLALYSESDSDTDISHCFLNLEIDPTTKVVSGTNTVTAKSLVNNLITFTLDLRDNMTVDGVTGAAGLLKKSLKSAMIAIIP